MKLLFTAFYLIFLVNCASHRAPTSIDGHPLAHDSFANGNIRASAVKRVGDHNICFDVTMMMAGIKKKQARTSNWTLAWVDQKNRYHLINLPHRDPASVPFRKPMIAQTGQIHEWSNTFTTCIPDQEKAKAVEALVLIPKELPYETSKGIELRWNEAL